MATIIGSFSTDLAFNKTDFDESIKSGQFTTNLLFTQINNGNIKGGMFTSHLVFVSAMHQNNANRLFRSQLALAGAFRQSVSALFSSNLTFQSNFQPLGPNFSNTLGFTDSFRNIVSVLNQLNLVGSFTATLGRTGQVISYLRFSNSFNSTSPRCLSPNRNNILLTGGGKTITLSSPLIGDKDNLNYSRIESRSRNNNLTIIAAKYWPKVRQLNLDFTWISQADGLTLQNFLESTAGQRIAYTDFYGVTRNVLVLNPDAEFNHLKNGYSVSLTLEYSLA